MKISKSILASIALSIAVAACERASDRAPDEQPAALASVAGAPASRWPSDPFEAQAAAADDSAVRALPMCGPANAPLTGDSIGPLRPGITLAELDLLCPHSIAQWDLGDEAIPEPSLAVNLGGASVMVVLTDTMPTGTIYSLWSKDARLQTPEHIGVGSTVQELRNAYGTLTLAEAECSLFALLERAPGLSFRVTIEGLDTCEGTYAAVENPSLLKGANTVWRVILYRRSRGA